MRKISLSVVVFTLVLLFKINFSFAQSVKFDDWKNLTTSGKLPKECKIQHSNNNMDLVRFKGKYYLAFRTAPTHFASTKALLYIISSADFDNWKYEGEIAVGADIREPRFAVYHDTLNLYCFTGGKRMFRFEPHEVLVTQTAGNTGWSKPQSVNLDGFVPWRVRERKDTLYLSAYYGRNLYNNKHQANLRLFYSTNGFKWMPITDKPQVDVESSEEGEFIFDKAGDLYSTVRLEGSGAFVCKADKSAIGEWKKLRTKTKYDSALLFDHNDDVYLVSRRNLDGDIDKVKNRTNEKQGRFRNLIRYSITRKVTSLFKFNKNDLTLSLVTDFPSTGDTAYPGIAQVDNNTYILINYSSDFSKHQKNWIRGQLGKTYIYWTTLHFNR